MDIRVALIEDDVEIREHLAHLLNKTEGISCLQTFHCVEDAINPILNATPDIVLMDISLPGMNGIEGVAYLKDRHPDLECIMLTIHQQDQLVFDALCAGACGYLTKYTSAQKIVQAIIEAKQGGAPMSTNIARMVVSSFKKEKETDLSNREREVLIELTKGKSYKMVADTLFISTDTVRSHIRSIYKKLEVNSKAEAVVKAITNRLV